MVYTGFVEEEFSPYTVSYGSDEGAGDVARYSGWSIGPEIVGVASWWEV